MQRFSFCIAQKKKKRGNGTIFFFNNTITADGSSGKGNANEEMSNWAALSFTAAARR